MEPPRRANKAPESEHTETPTSPENSACDFSSFHVLYSTARRVQFGRIQQPTKVPKPKPRKEFVPCGFSPASLNPLPFVVSLLSLTCPFRLPFPTSNFRRLTSLTPARPALPHLRLLNTSTSVRTDFLDWDGFRLSSELGDPRGAHPKAS